MSSPPLPPGYQLEQASSQGKLPPLPPLPQGYQIQPQQEGGFSRFLRGAGLPANRQEAEHFLPSFKIEHPIDTFDPGTLLGGLVAPKPSDVPAAHQTPLREQEWPIVGGIFRGSAETMAQPGVAPKVYGMIPGVGPAGYEMGKSLEKGDLPAAAGSAVNIVGQVAGAKSLIRGGIKAPRAPEVVPPAATEALGSLIDSRGGAVDPHAIATDVLPVLRNQLARDGVDLSKLQGRAVGKQVLDTTKSAIQSHQAEVAEISKPYSSVLVEQRPIADAYRSQITPELQRNAPEVASRLESEAKNFDQPAPLFDVNALRIRLNNETAAAQGKAEVGGLRKSDIETRADVAAVIAAREVQYSNLAKVSGLPEDYIRGLQRTEGQLMETRDSLTKEFNRASAAHAESVSRTMREKVTGAYPSTRGVTHAAVREVLGPKPMDVFNNRIKTAFGGDLGEGTPQPSYKTVQPPTAPTSSSSLSAPGPTLGPGAPGLMGTTRSISIDGAPVGHITYDVRGDTLTINNWGGPKLNYDAMSNLLGRDGLAKLTQQIVSENPGVKFVQGIRTGGARGEAGRSVRIPVDRLPKQAQTAQTAQTLTEKMSALPPPTLQRITMPSPPTSHATPSAISGPARAASIAAIMSSLKNGEISQSEADSRIQRARGGGSGKTIRMPERP